MDLPAGLTILVIADEPDAQLIVDMLASPGVLIHRGDGTDETLVLADRMYFDAVVVTASLAVGDGTAMVGALRDLVRPRPFHVVLVGDADGPIRTAADASDLMIDRFVGRPLNRNGLRFAVVPRELMRQAQASPSSPAMAAAPDASAYGFGDRDHDDEDAEVDESDTDDMPFRRREPTIAARPRGRAATMEMQDERESTIPGTTNQAERAAAGAAPGVPVAITTGDESYGEKLREKMAEMARRLFQDTPAAPRRPTPRVSTDVDFAAIDNAMNTAAPQDARFVRDHSDLHMSSVPAAASGPGGAISALETGQLTIGISDAATLIARLWQRDFTGQLTLTANAEPTLHHQLFFVAGRLVFAATSAPQFRLGAILVREGKLTAQEAGLAWEEAALSGRRHGEVLVERGLMKRRELLPALRRQLEAIVFHAFGWMEGTYVIAPDVESGERVLLTRHTLALLAEGIRRKWSPAAQARCLGDDDTQFELGDRQKLGELLQDADLSQHERDALLGIAGRQSVRQIAGLDEGADLLALVWFAACLGAAHVFRPFHDDAVLVSDTDLAVDRARITRRLKLASHGDYFGLLGLNRDATRFEVRRAHEAVRREFAAEAFPVAIRGEMARELAAIARALDEAYGVLVDDVLRQAYAQQLSPSSE